MICVESYWTHFKFSTRRIVQRRMPLTFISSVYEHLENPNSYARTLLVEFSCAFNTIKPHLLIQALFDLGISCHICRFVLDFISYRRQTLRVGNKTSTTRVKNSVSQQGCFLSPVLFIHCTGGLVSHSNNCCVMKYADDIALLGLISEIHESYYIRVKNYIN